MKAKTLIKITSVFFTMLMIFIIGTIDIFADATLDLINNEIYPRAAYKKDITTPLTIQEIGGRYISPVTGNMEIKCTDLSLKGKNGLDFNLTRYYSLQQSNTYDILTHYSIINGQQKLVDDRYPYTLNDKLFDIGTGWALDLPHLVVRSGWPRELHIGSKGVIFIMPEGNFDVYSNCFYLKDENLQEYRLKYDYAPNGVLGTFNNGQSNNMVADSVWALEEKDGRKYFFNYYGYLIGIGDRYDNHITFQYSTRELGDESFYYISHIIDSVGRDIYFNYNDTNNTLTVSVYGDGQTKSILYQKALIRSQASSEFQNYILDSEYYLSSVTDVENRVTSYLYHFNLCKADADVKEVNSVLGDGNGVDNFFACLRKINYPSGGYSVFINYIYTKNLGEDGSMQFYKMFNSVDYNNTTSISKVYLYNRNDSAEYDGWPYSEPYGTTTDVMTFNADGTENTDRLIFDDNCLLTNSVAIGPDYKNETINEYDSNRQLAKTTYRTYNKTTGQYVESIQNFTYDIYRDLLEYWSSKAAGDKTNIEYKTTYQYHPTYHYLISKTYKRDAGNTIREQYLPTSDGKSIEYAKVFENGVLKKQTQFLYDVYGNVIEEKNYLDNWTDYNDIKYCYDDNVVSRNGKFNGLYLTRKYVEGVLDADNLSVAAIAGNNPGTVDERYIYDWFGNVKEKQDGQGNTTSYQYDKLGRVTRETYSDTTYKTMQYVTNSTENYTLVTNELGKQLKYGYDRLGNLLFEQDVTTGEYLNQYKYDRNMRICEENNHNSSEDSRKIEYEYIGDGRIKRKTIRDKGNSEIYNEVYTYDDAYVDPATGEKYQKAEKTVTTYYPWKSMTTNVYTNKHGEVVKTGRIYNGIEYADTYKYDYIGNKTEEKSARAYQEGWTNPWTAKYEYDFAGRPVKTFNIEGNYTLTEYDALGKIKAVTDFKGNLATPKYSTTYKYDKLGRTIEENIPFAKINNTIYNTIKKNYYDRNGNVIISKTSSNKPGQTMAYSRQDYEYNTRNLLTKVLKFETANKANYTQYYYDAAGNKLRQYTGLSSPLKINGLDKIVDGSDHSYSTTKYEYDHQGRLLKMTDPMGMSESYGYDANGNMTSKTDRNGNITTNIYDYLSRLKSTSVVTPDGKGNTSHTYEYGFNDKVTLSDNITYEYDSLDRLMKETDGNIVKEYAYDAADNRKTYTLTLGGVVKLSTSYTYDNMNRLYQVFENDQLVAIYTYDENGNRKSLKYSNGNDTAYVYNLANKLVDLSNTNGAGSQISHYSYEYYLDGNQSRKSDSTSGKATTYSYDGLSRLTSESNSSIGTVTSAIGYIYDDYNNRKTLIATGINPYTTSYVYDLNSRLLAETKEAADITEVTSYSYDNNGNQIYKGTEVFVPDNGEQEAVSISVAGLADDSVSLMEYNGLNQLIKTTSDNTVAEYTYNANGLRAAKSVNGVLTKHVWDGDQISIELNGAGNITSKYIRGINLICAETPAGGTKKWYAYNGHGDVVQLTDTAGNTVKSYEYDAFGSESNIDPNDTNVSRYCGEYFDSETGNYYLRARYYDSEIGRFISEDSVWGSDSDPLSLNLYTYCLNNPVNMFDPSGHEAEIYLSQLISLKQEYATASASRRTEIAALGVGLRDKIRDSFEYIDGWYNFNDVVNASNLFNGPGGGSVAEVQGLYSYLTSQQAAYKREQTILFCEDVAVVSGSVLVAERLGASAISAIGAGITTGWDKLKNLFGKGQTVRDKLLNSVTNQKLWNCIDQLYRPGGTIGDGGTADFVRNELVNGVPTGMTSHIPKALERIANLQNIINKQNLNANDLKTAQKLLQDLTNALNGK